MRVVLTFESRAVGVTGTYPLIVGQDSVYWTCTVKVGGVEVTWACFISRDGHVARTVRLDFYAELPVKVLVGDVGFNLKKRKSCL